MRMMLTAAWIVRSALLVLWLPFLLLSGIVRVLKEADCWSSAVIEADDLGRILSAESASHVPAQMSGRQLATVVTMPMAR